MDNKEEKKDINKEPIIELPDVEQLIGSKNIKNDVKQQKPPIQNIPPIKIEAKPAPEKKPIVIRQDKVPASAPKTPEKEMPVLTKPVLSEEPVEMASAETEKVQEVETEEIKEEVKPVQKTGDAAKELSSDKPAISEEMLRKITEDPSGSSRPKLKFRNNDNAVPEEAKSDSRQKEGRKPAADNVTEIKTSRQRFEHQDYSPVEQTGILPSVIIVLSVLCILIVAYLSIIQYFNLPVPSFIRNIIDAVYSISS
ncbi:hypothetical protein M0R36_09075 [bacterium]|jgi:hypothetical protein|nr:hypothetical protein [bacterium]